MMSKPRFKRYLKKITNMPGLDSSAVEDELQRIFRGNYDLICNIFDYYAAFVGDEDEIFTDEFTIQVRNRSVYGCHSLSG